MQSVRIGTSVRNEEPVIRSFASAISVRGILAAQAEVPAAAKRMGMRNQIVTLDSHLAGISIADMEETSDGMPDTALPNPDNEDFQKFMFHYQQMILLYESAIKRVTMRLDLIEKECAAKGHHVPIRSITSRIKNPVSINRKLKALGFPLTVRSVWEHLHDVAGVRVVCDYRNDIYAVRNILAADKHMELIEEKDYIKNPKGNGYRSLHLIVSVPVPLTEGLRYVKCEIQLRTTAMDLWASLEHHLRYKNTLFRNERIDCELKQCADALDETDRKMQYIAERMRIFDEISRDALVNQKAGGSAGCQEGNDGGKYF
jgi:putative GTP pyrophosphokinase